MKAEEGLFVGRKWAGRTHTEKGEDSGESSEEGQSIVTYVSKFYNGARLCVLTKNTKKTFKNKRKCVVAAVCLRTEADGNTRVCEGMSNR